MTRRAERLALGAVLVVGLALRVWWIAVAARDPVGLHDPTFYQVFGSRLADCHGYSVPDDGPTAYYPVGYPAVLAVGFWLADAVGAEGMHLHVTVALNLVCGLAAIALAWWIGKRVGSARTGLVAAAIVALYPNLVYHSAVSLTESLFLPIALGTVALLLLDRDKAAGLALGAGALVRPVLLPLLVVLPFVWRAGGAWRPALRRTATVAVCAALAIVPWTIRNAVRMDGFVPISTNTGDNLCMSRQPGAKGGFLLVPHCFASPELEGLHRPAYEVERERRARRLAVDFVRDHPGREVRLWFSRLRVTFAHGHDGLDAAESYGEDPFLTPTARSRLADVADWSLWALLVAALAAVPAVIASRQADRLLVLAAAVAVLLNVVAFFGDPRFHVPAVPFMALLAALGPRPARGATGPPLH